MADDPKIPFKRASDLFDVSTLPYTPSVLADWDGAADPGNSGAALDQLAERVKDLEGLPPAGALAVAVGAEDANVITVTYGQTDAAGAALRTPIVLTLIEAGGVLADGTAFAIDDTTGAVLGADVAGGNVRMVIVPDAAGAAVVTITDKAGASGLTRYLQAEAAGVPDVKVSTITFD